MQAGLNQAVETLAKRLKHARTLRGMTQAQLSDASGVKQPDISKIERGEILKSTGLLGLARALSVSPDWLDVGDGPMDGGGHIVEEQRAVYSVGTEIHQYATGGKMGGGLVLKDQPGIIQSWRVTPEWIQKNVHNFTSVRNLAIVTGFGDSMRPLYNPGDPLLVDTGVKVVEFDAIYFFRVGDEGFIKRLQRIPGNGLLAISENRSYRDWTVPAENFEVFARVVKVWRGEDF